MGVVLRIVWCFVLFVIVLRYYLKVKCLIAVCLSVWFCCLVGCFVYVVLFVYGCYVMVYCLCVIRTFYYLWGDSVGYNFK